MSDGNFWCPACEAYYDEFTDDSPRNIGDCVECGADLYSNPDGFAEIHRAFETMRC